MCVRVFFSSYNCLSHSKRLGYNSKLRAQSNCVSCASFLYTRLYEVHSVALYGTAADGAAAVTATAAAAATNNGRFIRCHESM